MQEQQIYQTSNDDLETAYLETVNLLKAENQLENELEIWEKRAAYYEKLLWALSNDYGKQILVEINSFKNDLTIELTQVATKTLTFPYEYTKDELNLLKIKRAQIDSVNRLLGLLSIESLTTNLTEARVRVKSLRAGDPLEPSY